MSQNVVMTSVTRVNGTINSMAKKLYHSWF